MRRQGVVLKLFAVTTSLILIVFSIVMIAEGLFFERFYRTSKIHTLEQNISRFEEQYDQVEHDHLKFSRLLGAFMNETDTSTSLLNQRFDQIIFNPYFLVLQTDHKIVTVPLPTDGMEHDALPKGIQIGDPLVIDGIFMDEDDTVMQPITIQKDQTELTKGLTRVQGKIIDLMVPEHRSYNPLYQDTLIDEALQEWMPKLEHYQSRLQEGAAVHLEWVDNWSGVPYAIVIQPLATDEPTARYLFVMTSLQPVGEAVDILKKYFVYLAPMILGLVTILSMIYSRIVTRPLVTLNHAAARIANLDFTGGPGVDSKDEFGELSHNLNVMSQNLDTALQKLTNTNDKLQAEIEEKQRSEQLRKELIANISHELKTPLGIVRGFAEGLQDGVANDKKERYLDHIVNETDRMNALIMDMLELSKFEAEAIQLTCSNFSMTKLVRNLVDSFSHQMKSRRIQYKLNHQEEQYVTADSRRIEQVILNLMSNAIRHAVENSVITITIDRDSSGKILTVIENTGSPIAENDLSRVWDQFYRIERSRDRKSGGTGLGLSIVKHILELHHSEFGVMNTNNGVAFSFTLYESGGELHE
ncbi:MULTISPECIES: sensor histidine kinase [Sporosarcina]|uniref:sensor histidine kinase n=1 Tax=Sporosarcina TaxID=1569 RepID=UPI00129BBB3D|nr:MULTISPECIES: ATP-binding protein [Sporosarcina]GKV64899.1 two-component sensor histidine kinase [Sporosarcina sp. NCCP-2331]GLB55009.1 two-component sensor histidine kinase [Sporosarcina sp. NCCP-2378]